MKAAEKMGLGSLSKGKTSLVASKLVVMKANNMGLTMFCIARFATFL